MTKQAIIARTIKAIHQLPEDKAAEISDFADYLAKQYEEQQLTDAITQLAAQSSSFEFLKEDEDVYTESDLKEVYNG